jgi:hypothetical protein
MQEFISRDGATKFFNDMLNLFEVQVFVGQSILTIFLQNRVNS